MNKLLVDGIYATNIVKLKDIAEKKTTKNIDGLVTETFTNSAENGIISQSDFFDRTITNEKNISGYFIVEPDDFVYNPRISTFAPVGPINRNKLGRSGVMSPLYLVFHTHDVEPEYLEWYFKSNTWHQFMRDNGNTGARSDRFSISNAEFFNMPIPIPPVKVQKAIAKTLTTLDTKVTLEKNEVEKFQNLKSAMLTKMFPKKGGNVPEIRFDGFTDVWEQRKLGEVTELKSASRVHKGEWTDSGVPFFRSSDVMAAINGATNEKAYISEELYEKLSSASGKLEKGDVLVTGGGSVGNPYIVPNNEPLYTKDADLLWIKNQGRFHPYFLYEYFFSPTFRTYLNSISHVGTIAHYTITQLSETSICLPDIEEQIKVGEYFDSLDRLITFHQRKYEKLVDTKKAFLEKLIGGEK